MINWLKYHFSAKYLFSQYSPQENQLLLFLIIIFILFLLIALILFFVFSKRKNILQSSKIAYGKFANLFIFTAIGGLLLIFFRWQEIPILSAPILILMLLLVFVIILVYNILYLQKIVKPSKKDELEEQNYQKYLPRKKQRK